MPVPSYRVPVRVARGTLSALTAGISDLQEGEICYATDGNALYVVEGGVLTIAGSSVSGDLVDDTTPQLGGPLDVNGNEIVSLTNENILVAPDGTGVLELRGNTGNDAAIQLNCETNGHGVKIQSPPHSAAASYTLVLPDDTGTTGQALTTDGAGVLSWATPSTVGSIDDLTDVDTTTSAPTTGQGLVWDGAQWAPGDVSDVDLATSSIDELSDVDTSSVAPTDGQALVWSTADSEWVPGDVAADLGATSINALSDVDTTTASPTNDQVLAWNGTSWVPADAASGGGGGSAGVALVGVTDSQLGVFNDEILNVSFPGSPVEGDLAIFEITSRAGGDPNAPVPLSVPSGWTLYDSQEYISSSSTADVTSTIIYKELDASDISAGTVAISNQTTNPSDDWYAQLAIFRNAFISSSSIVSTTATGTLPLSGYDYTGVAAGVGGFNFVTAPNIFATSGTAGVRVIPEPGVDLNWLNGSSNNDGYELNVVRRVSSFLGTGTLAFNIKGLDDSGVAFQLTDGFHIMVVNVSPKNSSGGGGGGGGSSAARLTEAQTAASGIATFAGIGHSGTLVEVTSSLDAWIVLYDSASSRTADNGRAYNTDPASGSGVLAEFYITAGTTVLATPGTTYFNNDTSVTEAVYAAVRDQAGSDVGSVVTITAYGNQSITSVSGGTFGSGV